MAYLVGRSLISYLGPDLGSACRNYHRTPPAPALQQIGEQTIAWHPIQHEPIPADLICWQARAQRLLRQAIEEAGSQRDTPLIIASSSLNIGALERGESLEADGFCPIENWASALGWQGPLFYINTACTSALNALSLAHSLLQTHREVSVLGVELANAYTLQGFAALQLLSPDGARPLAPERNGLVLGEAVAVLRLSREPSDTSTWQVSQATHILDGRDPTGASSTAITHSWQSCLQASASQPDAIKLQAAGSLLNDPQEVLACQNLHLSDCPHISLKAHLGHTLGAAAAAEIALLSALIDAGQTLPSPRDGSDHIAEQPQHILLSHYGFGGSHAAAALSQRLPPTPAQPSLSFRVVAEHKQAPPENWPSQLSALLGYKPRRLGRWVELGLWGALRCMQAYGHALPPDTIIRVCSLNGPQNAISHGLTQLAQDALLPFGFLQSQASQLLAHLSQALHWQGDAQLINHRDASQLLALACQQAGHKALLIGWLEDEQHSHWRLLVPNAAAYTPTTSALEYEAHWEHQTFSVVDGALFTQHNVTSACAAD